MLRISGIWIPAQVPYVPQGVNCGVLPMEHNQHWGGGHPSSQGAAIEVFLHILLHPFLQLLGDVLVLPFCHVGNNHTRIERAGAGADAEVLDGLLPVVQIAHICILKSHESVYILSRGQIAVI